MNPYLSSAWQTHRYGELFVVQGPTGQHITDYVLTDADAHLIAAAPALRDALRHVAAILNAKGGPTAAERDEATNMARAALHRAEGGSA